MKKFLCLILALALLSLNACSKKEDVRQEKKDPTLDKISVVTTDTDSMKKKAVEALNSLEDISLSEKGITVFSSTDMKVVPEDESTVYSYNLVQRNRMFEKKYSTALNQFSQNSEDLLTEAYYNMLAGIGFADLFVIPAKDLSKYAAKGILLNTTALPNSDFSAAWFNYNLMQKSAHSNDSYAVYGDFNKDIPSYYCIYVNRTLLKQAGMKMPYKDVTSGEWTWDKLIEMSRNSTAANEENFILSTKSNETTANVCFKSAGLDYISSSHKATPAVSFANENSQNVLELLRSLNAAGKISNDTADFTQGSSLFYLGTVRDTEKVKFLKDDWCILPVPKTNTASQSYTAYMDENHSVLVCYAGASNSSKLFYALEGLNAASYGGYLTDAYYNELILYSLRDSDTLNMLDYICGVKSGVQTTDFTDYYADSYPDLYLKTRTALAEAASGSTVDVYTVEETAKAKLEPIFRSYFTE
ncbi:MAG: extracellular solute-binding protein [Clostridia bacterium]|nr:extracellular solute-binding protein [Clostridia bacterium]